ncbi:MAG: hypothetical protein QM606_11490 [Leucobacter sp.]
MIRVSKRAGFVSAVAALALTLIMIAATPSIAEGPGTPEDVERQFSDSAIAAIQQETAEAREEGPPEDAPDFSAAAGFGQIRQIHQWTKRTEEQTPLSFEALEEWIAPILDDRDRPLGIYRVWRPAESAVPEQAGFNDYSELGQQLQELDPGAIVIEDPMSSGWFAWSDGFLEPLNEYAAMEVPRATEFEEAAPIIEKRIRQAIEDSSYEEGLAGSGLPLEDLRPWYQQVDIKLGAGIALLGAGLIGGWLVIRRSRSSDQRSTR